MRIVLRIGRIPDLHAYSVPYGFSPTGSYLDPWSVYPEIKECQLSLLPSKSTVRCTAGNMGWFWPWHELEISRQSLAMSTHLTHTGTGFLRHPAQELRLYRVHERQTGVVQDEMCGR